MRVTVVNHEQAPESTLAENWYYQIGLYL